MTLVLVGLAPATGSYIYAMTQEIRQDLWGTMSLDELIIQQRLLDERLSYAYSVGMAPLVNHIAQAQTYISSLIASKVR